MKIVTGLFTADDVITAVHRLTENNFSYNDLSLMSSAAEMPDYLEGEPEAAATSGAAVGAVAGGSIGALGTWVASAIPGFESMFVSGLITTAVGGVIGGYLGSLYTVRATSQTKLDIHEELEAGNMLMVVKTDGHNTQTAVTLMTESNGQHIEMHTIPDEEFEGSE